MARTFKIFYSWQSDLPANTTRTFIGSAIDDAEKYLANTVKIIPDRDTKGETGSPNIEKVIFEKINDCDLFVGDLTIVTSYTDKDGKKKYTPNPNVLIELGYAVKVLGWKSVICFVNEDYGDRKKLPFDLNHHRVTGYSLKNTERANIKKELRDIISSTVMTIMENGIRPREGFASHIVGSYDFESKLISEKLIPFDIQNSEYVVNYKNSLILEAKQNIDDILSIHLPHSHEVDGDTNETEDDTSNENLIVEIEDAKYEAISKPRIDIFQFHKQKISEEEQSELRKNAKRYFDIELEDDFFYLGDLECSAQTYPLIGLQQRGADEAKEKYRLIMNCIHQFTNLMFFEKYIKTYDGLLFFPLAIWNRTTTMDKDITISIIVDEETAEVVIPDDKLISDELREVVGFICKQQFVELLLKMPESSDIMYGKDNDAANTLELEPQMVMPHINPLGYMQEPEYDIDDYMYEIQEWIATPLEQCYNEFNFHLSKLRPMEKNWLSRGILIKPRTDIITMVYKVTSDHSDGAIEGLMKYEIKEMA